jgi:hypothetical protein
MIFYKKHCILYKFIYLFLLGCLTCTFCYSQVSEIDKNIISPFNEYSKIPREVAFVHLNKSIYIKGETLAFTAYVFDKNNKTLSNLTTNLYCIISDERDVPIKKTLIRVENGVATGQFFVDSLFTTGHYTFKAYTNWMRNFDELNFYAQSIEVIDPEVTPEIKTKTITNILDAQFLPEGGHIVAETENSMGVVIKDSLGFGIPFVEGTILNETGLEVTTFKTNEFGIGKFSYIPKNGETYTAQFEINKTLQEKKLGLSQPKGINLKLTDLGNKIALAFNTNEQTLPELINNPYLITIHNGKSIKVISINFENTTQLVKVVDYVDLFSGMNIITMFDHYNKPILERLFFKYDGLTFLQSGDAISSKVMDSIHIKLPIKNSNTAKFSAFSISVLPNGSKSYNQQHNIVSYTMLQPYVKSYIQNGAYYFTNVDRKKKYYLDNLLLTQGWSSYDWNNLFNNPPRNLYDFETGIMINATVNKRESGQYLIYPTRKSKSNLLALEKDEKAFKRSEFFPYEDDKLKIGEILKNGKVENPFLYLQFSPSTIPDFKLDIELPKTKGNTQLEYAYSESLKPAWEKVQELDEVVITTEKEATRLEKLKRNSQGNIDIFDDAKRQQYFDIASYLSAKGFRVTNTGASISIVNTSSPTPNNRTPLVYLDKMLLFDFSILLNYQMNNIDYIIIDKSGFGEGVRGSAGVIKIFTDPSLSLYKLYGKSYQEYEIPLTFSENKRFYTPVYNSYSSEFFKDYGVIGWVPNISIDANGFLNFNIFDTYNSTIDLCIEGVTEEGRFMSEVKTITIN